jgi:hypothetical protein
MRRDLRGLCRWLGGAVVAAAALAVGCSDDGAGPVDGDLDASRDPAGEREPCRNGLLRDGLCTTELLRRAPAEECPSGRYGDEGGCWPRPPDLRDWVCPPGWGTETWGLGTPEAPESSWAPWVDPVEVCHPVLPASACPPSTMPVPGVATCARVGLECPTDGESWHDEATIRARAPGLGQRIRYVRLAGTGPGEGSRERPFTSLAAAFAGMREGDILALAPGTYEGGFGLDAQIAVVGACAEHTRIIGPPGASSGVAMTGAGARLTDLTVGGGGTALHLWDLQVPLALEGLVIEGPHEVGISVYGGGEPVSMRDVVVRGSSGMFVIESRVRAERIAFLGNVDAGIVAQGEGAELTLTDAVVADTQPRADGQFGYGVEVSLGASAELRRAVVERAYGLGVFAIGPGTRLTLEDVRIADTRPGDLNGGAAFGLQIGGSAEVQLERTVVSGSRAAGVVVSDRGSRLVVQDLLIADTGARRDDQRYGNGLYVQDGGEVAGARVALVRNGLAAIALEDPETRVVLEDVVVADTQPLGAQRLGLALAVRLEATATLRRAALLQSRTLGMRIYDDQTHVVLEELVVADTVPHPETGEGTAIQVDNGARLDLTVAVLQRSSAAGVFIYAATASLTDVLVADTQPIAWTGGLLFGRGVVLDAGGVLTARRLALLRNHEIGLEIGSAGGWAVVTDLLVRDTRTLGAGGGGNGIVVYDRATLSLDGFAVSESGLAGLLVSRGGAVIATAGLITQNLVGVNIQGDAVDYGRDFANVRSEGNQVDLDTSALPLPDSAPLVEWTDDAGGVESP